MRTTFPTLPTTRCSTPWTSWTCATSLSAGRLNGLTPEDLYVLLMGALFHDVGRGVSVSDFEQFRAVLGFEEPGR